MFVEAPATCDEAKCGVVEAGEDPAVGEVVLGVRRTGRDSEDGMGPVRPGHAEPVAGLEFAEPIEHCRAYAFGIDMAEDDRGPGLTRCGSKPVPADRHGSI